MVIGRGDVMQRGPSELRPEASVPPGLVGESSASWANGLSPLSRFVLSATRRTWR